MDSDAECVEYVCYVKDEVTTPYSPRSETASPQSLEFEPEKDFILLFETLPVLWDRAHPHYTNKYKRNENIRKLLPILKKIKPNATVEDVKKKINTFRSNYRRELNKIRVSKKSGAGEIYVPKIWYFPYLNFLRRGRLAPLRREQDPIPHTRCNGASAIPSQTGQEQEQHQENVLEEDSTTLSSTNIEILSHPLSLKKKKKDPIVRQNELLDRTCSLLSQLQPANVSCTNPINTTALYWSEKLDKLDPTQKLYAEKFINEILLEAELGNLGKNSVHINCNANTFI